MEPLSIEKVQRLLREKGLRPTTHRLKLTQFLLSADHPTADVTFRWAKENLSKVSRATIYNTLNELVAKGILKEVKCSFSTSSIFDNNTEDHHHFYDKETGKFTDLSISHVSLSEYLEGKYSIDNVEVTITGREKKSNF